MANGVRENNTIQKFDVKGFNFTLNLLQYADDIFFFIKI